MVLNLLAPGATGGARGWSTGQIRLRGLTSALHAPSLGCRGQAGWAQGSPCVQKLAAVEQYHQSPIAKYLDLQGSLQAG